MLYAIVLIVERFRARRIATTSLFQRKISRLSLVQTSHLDFSLCGSNELTVLIRHSKGNFQNCRYWKEGHEPFLWRLWNNLYVSSLLNLRTLRNSKDICGRCCGVLRRKIGLEANETSLLVYRTGETFAGKVVLKVGVMDDPQWPNQNVPKVELFDGYRVQWQKPIDGAGSLPGMP